MKIFQMIFSNGSLKISRIMNKHKSRIIRILATLVVAGICYVAYLIGDLKSIFGKEVNYLQWLMISIIILSLYPSPINSKNDSKRS